MAHYEKTITSETLFEGRIFRVTRSKVLLENGKTSQREIVTHSGGAAILPLTDCGEVFLVRQFRYAFGQELLEIPAGKLEPGEDPESAARRELLEECGITAASITNLMPVYPTVGYDTEIIHMYLAQGLQRGEAQPDPGEFVTVEKLPLKDAVDMVLRGEIRDGKTVAALLKVHTLLNRGVITLK